jgi:hypothetical protein
VTAGRLWAYLAIALPVLATLISSLSTVDLAYHLRAGAMTLDTGMIPTSDSFTFTAPGAAWLNQQWLSQVVLAAVYRVGGWTGLVVLRAALVIVLTACLFLACRRQGVNLRVAAWLTLGAFIVASVAFTLRPQLFGMALFAATLLIVVARRSHPRLLWLVPPLVVLWANLHGSFVLAPLVLGLAWLEDLHDRSPVAWQTLLVGLISLPAALVNPFGLGIWSYAAGLSTNSFITRQIVEWQPTTLRTAPGLVFFGSVLAVMAILLRRPRRVSWPVLAWLAAFLLIGAYAIRGVAWWPIAAVIALAGLLGDEPNAAEEPNTGSPRRANVIVAAGIALAGIALLPLWRPLDAGTGAPSAVLAHAPSGVTAQLRSIVRPGDRIFQPQPWGSWFEFAFPEASVAVDSRIEMFPPMVWDEYDEVINGGSRANELLDSWQVTIATARPDGDGGLIGVLDANRAWVKVFGDQEGVVYVRSQRASSG